MAIYINGKKVSGKGRPGLSPYQVAVNEGYTGTESAFNTQLKNIGQAAEPFNKLQSQVTAAEDKMQILQDQMTNIEDKTAEALKTISSAAATIFTTSSTEPTNTRLLWIDPNPNTGGLKYYNGTSWVHVPVAQT